jgi:phage terminase large subunit-like protein
MSDTMRRVSTPVFDDSQLGIKPKIHDLLSTPSHIIGPVWQVRRDGGWHLPKKTLGWAIIDWMTEYLKAPEGDDDEPFMPTFEQVRFLLWWYAVDSRGRYSYRSGVLRRMKGWGKDPICAAMAFAELCGPVAFSHFDSTGTPIGKQRPGALIQVAAVSQDQTDNTFDMFSQLATPHLIQEFKLEILKTLVHAKGGRRIQAVTSNPKSLEGKRPTFVIMNETQWWDESNNGRRMYQVINGNIVKRAGVGARYIAICNAHVPGQNSVGETMWDTYRAVESGQAVDTGLLYDALEAPADTPVGEIPPEAVDPDGFLAGLEALTRGLEVCRGDSHWLDIEAIILSILDENNPISESRRMFLNQINAAEDAWMTTAMWESVRSDERLQPGDTITLGFDGSKSNDFTALVACRTSDGLLEVIRVWNPEDHNGEVPKSQVDATVRWMFSHYRVVGFRADVKEFESYIASWTTDFAKKLKVKASPGNPIAFDMRGQTKKFAFDCEKFLDAVHEKALCHGGDKTLAVHVLNAHRHPTTFDAISIRKASKDSSRKIDAAVAAVLAFSTRQEFLMTKGNRTEWKGSVLT